MNVIHYGNLSKEMEQNDVTIKDMAKTLNIDEQKMQKKLCGEDILDVFAAQKITSKHFRGMELAYLFYNHHKNRLEDTVLEFDSYYGGLLLNEMTFNNINIELGRISEDIQNTDMSDLTRMGLRFRDQAHSIQLLADLLHYSMEDLNKNMEEIGTIKETLYDLVVRNEKNIEEIKKS